MRAGRSVKQTVTGLTSRRSSFPWLKLTFFAFCTKRTSTFFDCLPPAVQVISGFASETGVGDSAKVVNGFVMMIPAKAPHVIIRLFIFIGLVCSARHPSFIGPSVGPHAFFHQTLLLA